jgi:hypothetical protein
LEEEEMPLIWQLRMIILLPKQGTEYDLNTLRLITLLPIPYKLSWKVLKRRLSQILDENLPPQQAVLRCCRNSTEYLHP